MIFSLTCNFLKMDAYFNDLQKLILAKNCDRNRIRSNKVAASVNILNQFHL